MSTLKEAKLKKPVTATVAARKRFVIVTEVFVAAIGITAYILAILPKLLPYQGAATSAQPGDFIFPAVCIGLLVITSWFAIISFADAYATQSADDARNEVRDSK